MHVLMAALATARLTELFIQDRITERIRMRWPTYLWTCSRCVSVWAGIYVTVVLYFSPYLNYPFALSMVYLMTGEIMGTLKQRPRRRIMIEPLANGINVDWAGYDPRQALGVLKNLVSNIEQGRVN